MRLDIILLTFTLDTMLSNRGASKMLIKEINMLAIVSLRGGVDIIKLALITQAETPNFTHKLCLKTDVKFFPYMERTPPNTKHVIA